MTGLPMSAGDGSGTTMPRPTRVVKSFLVRPHVFFIGPRVMDQPVF